MRTIAVTGAAGLIGSAITRLLLERGFTVIAYDNFSVGTWKQEHPRLTWKHVDITASSLADALSPAEVDAVVHCAVHAGGLSLKEPSKNVLVNAYGSTQLFEWCARNHKHVIFLSSSVVYGDQPAVPISETARLNPNTIYGVNKVACENILRILEQGFGLPWTVLRLFATYGAAHTPSLDQGVINIMLTQLQKGDEVIVKGSLNRVRDFVTAYDVAQAVTSCLTHLPLVQNKILNVGAGVATTIEEMIFALIEVLGKKRKSISLIEQPGTVGDPSYNVSDIAQIQSLLGYKPQYDLPTGLLMMIKEREGGGR